jgi:aminocarboxymuconate-semialdehyde decarboxylase
MTIVDVHCHIVPAAFPPAPQSCDVWPHMEHRGNRQASVMIGGKEFRLVDNRCWDTARRIADMNEEEVGVQVLSPMPELLSYWIDAKQALDLARHVNRAIAEMIGAAPERFAGLGMVPLQDPDLAAKELAVLRGEYGLAGIEIGSNINGRPPGDSKFDAFFAEAERLDLAVFVHALHPPATDRLIGPPILGAFIGFPTDVGFAAASCITGRMLEKFPKLRIGFSHGGGTLAAFLPRLQSGWTKQPALKTGFASPTDTARRFYYDNIVFDRRLLRHLIDCFGDTQIFVGSDYPFTGGQQDSARMFDELGLSSEQLTRLQGGNAARFLNRDFSGAR